MFEDIQNENAVEIQPDISTTEDHSSEPSLVDKIYSGDLDYRSLDGSTRKTVLKEAYERLDETGKAAWDANWRDKPFFLGKNRDGSEAEWKSAEEYLNTLKIPQVKKERENHFIEENRRLKQEIDNIKNLTKLNLERNLDQEELAIEAEIARAKESFEFDDYEKALKKREILKLNKDKAKQFYDAPIERPNSEQEILSSMPEVERQAYLDFRTKNDWFGIDESLSQFATKEFNVIQQSNMSLKDKLEYVEKRTKAAFPSKFPKKTTSFVQTAPSNSNATFKSTVNKANSIWNGLPDRDKEKVNNLIASGKFTSKEAVLKDYGLI